MPQLTPQAGKSKIIDHCAHQSRHTHGTIAGYQTCKCRCAACRKVANAYRRDYSLRTGKTVALVPIAPAREHLQKLVDQGMPATAIAQQTGVPLTTVRHVLHGRVEHALEVTTTPLLQAVYDGKAGRGDAFPTATGATRLLQHLALNGWTLPMLLERIDIPRKTLQQLRAGDKKYLSADNDHKVRRLARELLHKTPVPKDAMEASKIRLTQQKARELGWVSIFAWDDPDDPTSPMRSH